MSTFTLDLVTNIEWGIMGVFKPKNYFKKICWDFHIDNSYEIDTCKQKTNLLPKNGSINFHKIWIIKKKNFREKHKILIWVN